ncbi:MAG: 3-hydroxyacyl-ACP dehydratase FabZ [Desulfitobacteriia bacterium]|jgi:3-hydroxyacyl-[acyl-carrier-protein] dehydratase
MVELGIKEIMEILPHRYPFLLLDKVVDLKAGKSLVAYKNVSMNEYFFQGHFPEEPVMPGVLIVEALAQAGAVIVLTMPEHKGKIAYFAGINKVRFRKKVVPGDVLKLEAEIVKIRGSVGIGRGVATVDGQIAAEGEIMFYLA